MGKKPVIFEPIGDDFDDVLDTILDKTEKLSPIDRDSLIDKSLKVEYTGNLKIGDFNLPCAVLNTKQRIIFQREFIGILTGHKKGNFDRYINANNLQNYVPDKFKGESWVQRIIILDYKGKRAHGLTAEDIIDLLDMYLKASNEGVLLKGQEHLAKQARILMRAFAKIGLVALIDEATGFQKDRKKDALRQLVEAYIIEDARKWTKEFYDPFFEALDIAYGNEKTISSKRPAYYGKFINDYVYRPIEKGLILTELKSLQNTDPNKRLHQFLNEDIGLKTLRDRIAKITGLLQAAKNIKEFKYLFEKMESSQKWLFDELE
jgi:hypothetical protein